MQKADSLMAPLETPRARREHRGEHRHEPNSPALIGVILPRGHVDRFADCPPRHQHTKPRGCRTWCIVAGELSRPELAAGCFQIIRHQSDGGIQLVGEQVEIDNVRRSPSNRVGRACNTRDRKTRFCSDSPAAHDFVHTAHCSQQTMRYGCPNCFVRVERHEQDHARGPRRVDVPRSSSGQHNRRATARHSTRNRRVGDALWVGVASGQGEGDVGRMAAAVGKVAPALY